MDRPGPVTSWIGVAAAAASLAVLGVAIRRVSSRVYAGSARPTAALDVDFAGCAVVRRGPTCELGDDRVLRLWVSPGVPSTGRLVVDGAVSRADVPRGEPFATRVPEGARSVGVEVDEGSRRLSSGLAVETRRPEPPAVAQSKELRAAGRLDDAANVLEAALRDAPGGERGPLLSSLARVELAGGHVDEASARFVAAIASHETSGALSSACEDALALAFVHLQSHRFSDARATLDRAAKLATDIPDDRAHVAYNEGLLAAETGDHRTAMRLALDAAESARRLGNTRLHVLARQESARQLHELGRYDESIATFRAIVESSGPSLAACDRADLLDNLGWAALMLREHSPVRIADVDARGPIEQALGLFRASCPDPNRTANALANLALADRQEGRLADAWEAIAAARRTATKPATALNLFVHDLEGRLWLDARRPAEALSAFTREGHLAASLGGPEDELVAREGRAEALAALGRRDDAIVELQRADDALDAANGSIPLGEGRDTYLAARERGSITLVDLLVATGRAADALAAARRARTRLLAGIESAGRLERLDPAARATWRERLGRYVQQRDADDEEALHDWELARETLDRVRSARAARAVRLQALLDDALTALHGAPTEARSREPEPGEVELAYFPSADGWTGFAADGRSVKARSLGPIDTAAPPEQLAAAILDPFHDALAGARRIRVLSEGALARVDVHALPFDGAPLLAHAPVEYVLDVRRVAPESLAPSRTAFVVADPTSDLASARAEATAVAQALQAGAGWQVHTVVGPRVTAAAVRDALAAADLVHYGGHGTYGGRDALESALPLAGDTELTLADVLGLPRVPPIVVLFGCETARDSAQGGHEALGLAHAFVMAGAAAVVATPRLVDDAVAGELATETYHRIAAAPTLDVTATLRDAELAVRARRPASDWAAFRVLVP
jgi:tetratricopeptide (TPR) repeat protein